MTALREKPVQLHLKPPGDDRPLGSYAVLISAFGTLSAMFAVWFSRSGRELPDRIEARDLLLLTVASHKLARLVSKDRITSPIRAPFTQPQGEGGPGEVDETSRGHGLRRAVGQLLLCPYCLGMWTSAGFVAGLLTLPRFTRWVASVFSIFFGSELLQIAYKKAEELV
ncbi:MAG TPA: DUF1360 domain-containing protein [Solirubrobacteraceae bacterium]|jgi:hypothetical protein|nr:DUF1360 domain-containing protein [Solirubrobacteraceae bacterium]